VGPWKRDIDRTDACSRIITTSRWRYDHHPEQHGDVGNQIDVHGEQSVELLQTRNGSWRIGKVGFGKWEAFACVNGMLNAAMCRELAAGFLAAADELEARTRTESRARFRVVGDESDPASGVR